VKISSRIVSKQGSFAVTALSCSFPACEAIGAATEETVGRLAFVRKLLIRFDARDTKGRQELAEQLPLLR
jgi:hypothetical protein